MVRHLTTITQSDIHELQADFFKVVVVSTSKCSRKGCPKLELLHKFVMDEVMQVDSIEFQGVSKKESAQKLHEKNKRLTHFAGTN